MLFLVVGTLLLLAFLAGGRVIANADPKAVVRGLRIGGGVTLLALAALLGLARQFVVAAPLAFIGLSLLGLNRGGGPAGGWRPRSRPSSGQRSSVKTAAIEVELDHDTGDIAGTILSGPYAGRELAGLTQAELRQVWELFASDPDSLPLLEAYLDRRFPGWREDFEAGADPGQGGAAGARPMSEQEAYKVLGLQPGASEGEIRAAHRRLMKDAHPDHGGSDAMAARLNAAKDVLLGRTR
jgi:hypothetical protein